MNKNLLICVFTLLIHHCTGKCSKQNPFYLLDNECGNFNEACIRKESEACIALLNACEQCPPNNFTASALIDLLVIFRGLEEKMNNLKGQVFTRIKSIEENSVSSFILVVTLFVILILVLIGLPLEFRFKCLKRLCGPTTGRDTRRYYTNLLPNDHVGQTDNRIDQINNHIDQSLGKIDLTINANNKKVLDRIDQIHQYMELKFADINLRLEGINRMSLNGAFSQCKVKIQISGIEEPIDIHINHGDNLVKVKQKIYAKWINANPFNYKLINLRLNDVILDDTQYLYSIIGSPDLILYCDIADENSDQGDSGTVVLQLRGNIQLPEMIQINRNITVDALKNTILKLINNCELRIFRESEKSFIELKEINVLNDYDWIQVIAVNKGTLTIHPIFGFLNPVTIEYVNVDSVSEIRMKLAENLRSNAKEFILLCDKKCLRDEDFIFQISIDLGSTVEFCRLLKLDDGVIIGDSIKSGDYSLIYKGRHPYSREEIIIKKYSLEVTISDLKENKAFLNELITFQVTKKNPRFIKLKDVFKDNDHFYIGMEKMEGSIKEFINQNELLAENKIVKWAKQILEALKYLHDNKIIHRNVNPSNILVDNQGNIKLSSFGVSKYVHISDPKNLLSGFVQSNVGTLRYMAPEVINDKPYGTPADIWSFGATLIEIATGVLPLHGKNEMISMMEIGDKGKIDYKLHESRSANLKDFIDCCLKENPLQRSSADNLLKHKLIVDQ